LAIPGDGVSYRTIVWRDLVIKRTPLEFSFSSEGLRLCDWHGSVCHRMLLLTIGERRVTLGANVGAYVISSGSIAFARPPSRFGEVFLGAQLIGNGGGYLGSHRCESKKTEAENKANHFARRASLKCGERLSLWVGRPRLRKER
jgi:hypothetical protein